MTQNSSAHLVRFVDKILDLEERHNLIERLLNCSCLTTASGRAAFIQHLPNKIKNSVRGGLPSTPKEEMDNLLSACVSFPNGLQELLKVIRYYNSGEKAVDELEEFMLEIGLLEYEARVIPSQSLDSYPANPFIDTQRVQLQKFVGRKALLRRINALLQASSIHLNGTQKIGKSSLLHLLFTEHQVRGEKAVFGDFQAQTVKDIVAKIALELELASNISWYDLQLKLAEQPFYLFLDKVDRAPQMGFDQQFGLDLKCLANYDFRLITSGRRLPDQILPNSNSGSLWYDFLSPEEVKVFTPTEVEQLLVSRLPSDLASQMFPASRIQQFIDLSGCHPFKLTRAAFRYYDYFTNDPDSDWQQLYQNDLAHFGLAN
jgi:Effector-associated domain 2